MLTGALLSSDDLPVGHLLLITGYCKNGQFRVKGMILDYGVVGEVKDNCVHHVLINHHLGLLWITEWPVQDKTVLSKHYSSYTPYLSQFLCSTTFTVLTILHISLLFRCALKMEVLLSFWMNQAAKIVLSAKHWVSHRKTPFNGDCIFQPFLLICYASFELVTFIKKK